MREAERLIELDADDLDDLYAAMRKIGKDLKPEQPTEMLRRLLEARGTGKTSRRPISPGRMRRVHAVIAAWLSDRAKRRKIPFNPATQVYLPAGKAPPALAWTAARVERWLQTGKRPSKVMVWTPRADRCLPRLRLPGPALPPVACRRPSGPATG